MDSQLPNLKQQLARPVHSRTVNDVLALKEATSHIQFFQDQIKESGPEVHAYCCQYMELEEFKAGQVVCRQGHPGFKFYIIFEGIVQVLQDNTDEMPAILSELGPGSAFGEMALICNRPRLATITCVTDCVLGVLHKQQYTQVLGKVMSKKLRASVLFLKSIPLFREWTRRRLERLYLFFHKRTYVKNSVVFRQGEQSVSVFIVQSGEFALTQKLQNSTTAQFFIRNDQRLNTLKKSAGWSTSTVAILSSREIIGYQEAKTGVSMSFTCTCTSNSGQLLVISKTDFLRNTQDEDSLRILDSCQALKQQIRSRQSASKETLQTVPSQSVLKCRPFLLHDAKRATSQSMLKTSKKLMHCRKLSCAQSISFIKQQKDGTDKSLPYLARGRLSKCKRLSLLKPH